MTDTPTPKTPPETPQPNTTPPVHLADSPNTLSSFIKSRRAENNKQNKYFEFTHFLEETHLPDFSDIYQTRALLESQAQSLACLFQYLIVDGHWNNLPSAFKAQKQMSDILDRIEQIPAYQLNPRINPPQTEESARFVKTLDT